MGEWLEARHGCPRCASRTGRRAPGASQKRDKKATNVRKA